MPSLSDADIYSFLDACRTNNTGVASELIQSRGANRIFEDVYPSLFMADALQNGSSDIIELLVKHGVKPYLPFQNFQTAKKTSLDAAVSQKNWPLLLELLTLSEVSKDQNAFSNAAANYFLLMHAMLDKQEDFLNKFTLLVFNTTDTSALFKNLCESIGLEPEQIDSPRAIDAAVRKLEIINKLNTQVKPKEYFSGHPHETFDSYRRQFKGLEHLFMSGEETRNKKLQAIAIDRLQKYLTDLSALYPTHMKLSQFAGIINDDSLTSKEFKEYIWNYISSFIDAHLPDQEVADTAKIDHKEMEKHLFSNAPQPFGIRYRDLRAKMWHGWENEFYGLISKELQRVKACAKEGFSTAACERQKFNIQGSANNVKQYAAELEKLTEAIYSTPKSPGQSAIALINLLELNARINVYNIPLFEYAKKINLHASNANQDNPGNKFKDYETLKNTILSRLADLNIPVKKMQFQHKTVWLEENPARSLLEEWKKISLAAIDALVDQDLDQLGRSLNLYKSREVLRSEIEAAEDLPKLYESMTELKKKCTTAMDKIRISPVANALTEITEGIESCNSPNKQVRVAIDKAFAQRTAIIELSKQIKKLEAEMKSYEGLLWTDNYENIVENRVHVAVDKITTKMNELKKSLEYLEKNMQTRKDISSDKLRAAQKLLKELKKSDAMITIRSAAKSQSEENRKQALEYSVNQEKSAQIEASVHRLAAKVKEILASKKGLLKKPELEKLLARNKILDFFADEEKYTEYMYERGSPFDKVKRDIDAIDKFVSDLDQILDQRKAYGDYIVDNLIIEATSLIEKTDSLYLELKLNDFIAELKFMQIRSDYDLMKIQNLTLNKVLPKELYNRFEVLKAVPIASLSLVKSKVTNSEESFLEKKPEPMEVIDAMPKKVTIESRFSDMLGHIKAIEDEIQSWGDLYDAAAVPQRELQEMRKLIIKLEQQISKKDPSIKHLQELAVLEDKLTVFDVQDSRLRECREKHKTFVEHQASKNQKLASEQKMLTKAHDDAVLVQERATACLEQYSHLLNPADVAMLKEILRMSDHLLNPSEASLNLAAAMLKSSMETSLEKLAQLTKYLDGLHITHIEIFTKLKEDVLMLSVETQDSQKREAFREISTRMKECEPAKLTSKMLSDFSDEIERTKTREMTSEVHQSFKIEASSVKFDGQATARESEVSKVGIFSCNSTNSTVEVDQKNSEARKSQPAIQAENPKRRPGKTLA